MWVPSIRVPSIRVPQPFNTKGRAVRSRSVATRAYRRNIFSYLFSNQGLPMILGAALGWTIPRVWGEVLGTAGWIQWATADWGAGMALYGGGLAAMMAMYRTERKETPLPWVVSTFFFIAGIAVPVGKVTGIDRRPLDDVSNVRTYLVVVAAACLAYALRLVWIRHAARRALSDGPGPRVGTAPTVGRPPVQAPPVPPRVPQRGGFAPPAQGAVRTEPAPDQAPRPRPTPMPASVEEPAGA